MNRKFSPLRLAATLGIAALTASVALAESLPEADEGSAPAETSAAPAARHCVAELAPVAGDAKVSEMVTVGCYTTFAAAIAAATHNTVMLSPDASPQSVSEADIAPAATRVIGIDYDGTYYGGASYTWYVNNVYGCNGGRSYVANIPNTFNNRLSSTRGFSGCRRNTSYDCYYQTGDWVRCFPNCVNVGGFMNNRASSKRWQYLGAPPRQDRRDDGRVGRTAGCKTAVLCHHRIGRATPDSEWPSASARVRSSRLSLALAK